MAEKSVALAASDFFHDAESDEAVNQPMCFVVATVEPAGNNLNCGEWPSEQLVDQLRASAPDCSFADQKPVALPQLDNGSGSFSRCLADFIHASQEKLQPAFPV